MIQNKQQNDALIGRSLHMVGVLAIALGIGLYYSLVYKPLVQKRENQTFRIEQVSTLLDDAGRVQTEHRRLREQLKSLEDSIAATRSKLPDELNATKFVSQVSNIAKSVGLQVVDYQQDRAQVVPTHSKTEIRFNCTGSYASICQFLDKVDHLARVVKVSKLDIESDPNLESYPFHVTFYLYYGIETHDTKERQAVL